MESFFITKSDNLSCQKSYDFNPDDLADIPCPDDCFADAEGSLEADEIELPLPPGTSENDFPLPLPPKQEFLNDSNNFSPSISKNKASEKSPKLKQLPAPENFNPLPYDEDPKQKTDTATDEFQEDVASKVTELFDDSKYSPSKVDSDDDNQDFTAIKPKVLGKEQAKKRLMAFSLTKQPSSSVKKQNKAVTAAKNKEKPPNPNKGTNVQEQFRATISAIEEEKKKMFLNMPSYLLMEMSELTKSSHSSMSSSIQLLEKLKNENLDAKNKRNPSKDENTSSDKQKNRKSFRRSRSRSSRQSKSKKRKRSRSKQRSSSRSRSKRSHDRSRRKSPNRSRRSTSRSRKFREEKSSKSDQKESQSLPRKKILKDWNHFKAEGLVLESEPGFSKNNFDESKSQQDEPQRRSRSPHDRSDFKPVFNYLNKGSGFMTFLRAKPSDAGNSNTVVFPEKIIKYTRTKPILCWSENPSYAKEFYMQKQMLLENCDKAVSSILRFIIDSKSLERDIIAETKPLKSRSWYPKEAYLMPKEMITSLDPEENGHFLKESLCTESKVVEDGLAETLKKKMEVDDNNEGSVAEDVFAEKKISLVNDNYLSDEEQVKEMVVGGLKVQLDLDMNSVRVRSKWDSDYEGENSEKESMFKKKMKEKINVKMKTDEPVIKAKETFACEFENAVPCEKKKPIPPNLVRDVESPSLDASTTGNLVSEYEEFLKMVSVDSNENHEQPEKVVLDSKPKTAKPKAKKLETTTEEREKIKSPKLGLTDWDRDSDNEEKLESKKVSYTESHDEFSILGKNEKLDLKLEKSNKIASKKKAKKIVKKKKLKKFSKAKKKKYEESGSEESSSESCDSDSDSDTDESLILKKKKKKKILKYKKKSKKDSSSESDTDSDDSRTKKKKSKKKKAGRKKESSSDDSEDEVQNVLLKQLDFKKQLIMKKIEEIDLISDKCGKKKEKEVRVKKIEEESSEETSSEKQSKGKKKKTDAKKKSKTNIKVVKNYGNNKKLRKSESSSESDSESSDKSVKKKKTKKAEKRKRDSSNSSDSKERFSRARSKSSNKTSKKNKKSKKGRSSSESGDSGESSKERKAKKKDNKLKNGNENLSKVIEPSFKDTLKLNEPDIKSDEQSVWESKKLWKKLEPKSKKKEGEDDWEASSSVGESEQEEKKKESSWDDEVALRETKTFVPEDSFLKTDSKSEITVADRVTVENNSTNTSEANNQLASETLKTSLSNFSFNENSFCSFGQELSRDFFLAERSYSNSGVINTNENLRTLLIEPRPFQSVSKDSEVKKPADSELYSPGYSDSELSEDETCKSQKVNNTDNLMKEDVYDPLNCDSENSVENNEIELSSIPLPRVSDILLPGEPKSFETGDNLPSLNSEGSVLKDFSRNEADINVNKLPFVTFPLKSCFTLSDFTPVVSSNYPLNGEKNTPTKRQLMSVKGQQKLISKAASVFQDESDEENIEPLNKVENSGSEASATSKEKAANESQKSEKHSYAEEKDERKKWKKDSRDRSSEREERKRSRSRERKSSSKSYSKRSCSPIRKRRSRTPEIKREKREIRSDSFEIEPLKSSIDADDLTNLVQPIPVLTGLETSSGEGLWSRSLVPGCEFLHSTENVIHNAENFDIYPPEESRFSNKNYDKDYVSHDRNSVEKSRDGKSKKERRKSRSRSHSPRKKHRSKSPENRRSPRIRSPRRKSVSPRRRDRSPFSPRKRSPKRKSPSRGCKSSRSPDKKNKSESKSPKKRHDSVRPSSSVSPRKCRSPKHRDESPRRKDSPIKSLSPKKDLLYSQSYEGGLQNRIPVIGTSNEEVKIKLSPSAMRSPLFNDSMGFSRHMADSSVTESEMYSSFYENEYADEFGVGGYSKEVGVNNLITVKNHDIEKVNSPERLSLDQRIELELGVPNAGSQVQNDQYQISSQVCPPFQEISQSHFQNSYNCDNTSVGNDNFYQNQNVQINHDYNGQYFNGRQQQPPPSYGPFQQYTNTQPVQSSVLQVGNIVEVVPTMQHPPPPLASKNSQIMQVGNVLQVVPSQKTTPPISHSLSHNYGPPDNSSMIKTQKATAVVAPSSIVPPPNAEAILNPLIKAIQLEREKRRKEKEKRKAEREARRKARQLRREAKLMSVNEKLKKSVQNEGLMLGQEVEDDELIDALDVPSPPIPVEIITVSSPSALPPAGKGILITAGFKPKPPSEKKEVKFADGICPGEGTSTSGGEDVASPPSKPKLPKEKRFKKKKTKVKKKVKVQIIRQIIQEEDDDEDDLSPPPPPPGDPPPVFFARFPFAGDAQFPVYQTQTTTTTTLTTVQYPGQPFE